MDKIFAFIIDPQVDFCKPQGALYVPGADDDMKRLANMINRLGNKIDDIFVTLDSHHLIDIAHPIFWIESATGKNPAPFTLITADDVAKGKFRTTNPRFQQRATEYVNELASSGRYTLCIWPPHTIIGSEGYSIHSELFAAIQGWEQQNFAMANMITKGSNFWTEHYSIFRADVIDATDPSTMLNTELITALGEADVIAWAGEAFSHCMANSGYDLLDNFGDDNIKKIVLIEDCSSSVPGFEDLGKKFKDHFKAKGGQISTSTEFYK